MTITHFNASSVVFNVLILLSRLYRFQKHFWERIESGVTETLFDITDVTPGLKSKDKSHDEQARENKKFQEALRTLVPVCTGDVCFEAAAARASPLRVKELFAIASSMIA